MLTPRGSWLASSALFLIGVGVYYLGSRGPGALGLGVGLAAYLAIEFARLHIKTLRAGAVEVKRELVQQGRVTPVLFAESPVTVRLTLTSATAIDEAELADFRPTGLAPGDDFRTPLTLEPGVPRVVEYELEPAGPGVLRFEGCELRFGDGLLAGRVVRRSPSEHYVFPRPGRAQNSARTVKRHNTLAPPGGHRLRRAGSGDELLDLRDYRPGDEPKMIAWKASARRDTLITRELESDVPVRVVLFVDASASVRVGTAGATTAAKLATVALGVARDALNARDPVGLVVLDDDRVEVLRPGRGRRHEHDLARRLVTASARPLLAELTPASATRHAAALCVRLYPDWLDPARNATPFALHWRAISDTPNLWVVLGLLALGPVLMTVARNDTIEALATLAEGLSPAGWSWLGFLVVTLLPGALAGVIWVGHGLYGFLPRLRRERAVRKRLGLVFAHHANANAALVERVIHDDGELVRRAAAFLRAHRVPLPTARPRPLAPRQFAEAFARVLGQARDHELYLVFAESIDPAGLDGLTRAIRAARARHHQVVIFAPGAGTPQAVPTAAELLAGRDRDADWRAEVARAGARVIELDSADAIGQVRLRLDQLRRGGRGVRR